MVKTKIAVLVSGGGTNLQALLDAQREGVLTDGEIVLVISSNDSAYALTRAAQAGVPAVVCSRKALGSQAAFEAAISQALSDHGVELLVLAGFMSILSADFTSRWPRRILWIGILWSKGTPGRVGLRGEGHRCHGPLCQRGAGWGRDSPSEGGGDSAGGYPRDTAKAGDGAGGVEAAAPGHPDDIRGDQEGEGPMNVYETHDLTALLAANSYPGRGIVLGNTADGKQSVAAYFIMGRSENSRNRIFVKEPDGLRTEAYDPAKLADPSLIIYHPVRQMGRGLIVTNGDQTDTIRSFLERGLPMEQALRTREFEPDGPNWTPRISGLLSPDGSYKLSILKSADAEGSACARYTFEYPALAGVGHFLHTYVCDGTPIPTFQGEPERVTISGTMEEFAHGIWDHLNQENKISLYVRFTDLASGTYQEIILNKNQ